MPLLRRVWPARRGRYYASGAVGTGKATASYLAIGKDGATVWRALIDFDRDWSDVKIIDRMRLYARNRAPVELDAGRGATPRVIVRAVGSAWPQTDPLTSAPPVSAVNADSGTLPTADAVWWYVDVTDLLRPRAPERIDGGKGIAWYGLRLESFDEASAARSTEIYSDDASAAPFYLELLYWDNHPPGPPRNVRPSDLERWDTATGTEVTISGKLSDADTGAFIQKVHVQVFPAGTSDRQANEGTVTPVRGRVVEFTGQPTSFAVTLTGLSPRTDYRQRSRVRDDKGDWGEWTSLAAGRFRTNAKPELVQLFIATEATTKPHSFGSIRDADTGAYITAVEQFWYHDEIVGGTRHTTTMWASGKVQIGGTPTRFDLEYAGEELHWHESYRVLTRIWDNDDAPSDYVEATASPLQVRGPSNPTPRNTDTKINTTVPFLTIGHSSNFIGYQEQLYGDKELTMLLHDTGEVVIASTNVYPWQVPSGKLSWGQHFWRVIRIRLTSSGAWTERSEGYECYINALPMVPEIEFWEDGVVLRADGVYVSPGPNIKTRSRFMDADMERYSEMPARKTFEIRQAATPQGSGTLFESRVATTQINEYDATGEHIEEMDTLTGWTPGGNTALAIVADAPFGGNALQITATPPASQLASADKSFALPKDFLSIYSGAVRFAFYAKASNLTNVGTVRIILESSGGNYYYYDFAPTVGSWGAVSVARSAFSAQGSPTWTNINRVYFQVYATGGGAVSMTLRLWRLALGSYIGVGTELDLRDGYRDAAGIDVWSRWYWAKVSQIPTTAVTAPAAGALADPTPLLAGTYTGHPGAAAQARSRFRIWEINNNGFAEQLRAYGPVAWWRMGELGGNLIDETGNGHTAVPSGGPTYGFSGALLGDANTGISFDGVDDLFSTAVPIVGSAFSRGLTLGAWGKLSTVGDRNLIRGASNNWLLRVDNINVLFRPSLAAPAIQAGTGTSFAGDDRYHLFGGTYDPANQLMAVWGDGVLLGVGAYAGPVADESGGLRLGDGPWIGLMDEPFVIDRPLSAAEWTRLYQLGVGSQRVRALVRTIESPGTSNAGHLPPQTLRNGIAYEIELEGEDADGLIGTSPIRSVTTAFAAPAAPTALVAAVDSDASRVDLSWAGSTLTEFQVYRKVGNRRAIRIDKGGLTANAFTDTTAPEGVSLLYEVINWDGRLGAGGYSDPAQVVTQLPFTGRWLLSIPAEPGRVYHLPIVERMDEAEELDWGVLTAEGRRHHIVETDVRHGSQGSLEVLLYERSDYDLIETIRELAGDRTVAEVCIKDPTLPAAYVGKIRPEGRRPGPHATQGFAFSYATTSEA